jgi:hypothetical protein
MRLKERHKRTCSCHRRVAKMQAIMLLGHVLLTVQTRSSFLASCASVLSMFVSLCVPPVQAGINQKKKEPPQIMCVGAQKDVEHFLSHKFSMRPSCSNHILPAWRPRPSLLCLFYDAVESPCYLSINRNISQSPPSPMVMERRQNPVLCNCVGQQVCQCLQ